MPEPRDILPERASDAVKGDHGHVLVVAGSGTYPSTAGITALAALRTGTDLVTIAAPGRAADISGSVALNIVSERLDGDKLLMSHSDTVLDLAARADSLVIGPGLGRIDTTQRAVRDILDRWDGPAVVDADAIHAVADHHDLLDAATVVTPHRREFEALTGDDPGTDTDARRPAAERAAADLGCTVLLKGPVDIVTDGTDTRTNATGNPTMSRGGTGDSLAGITAAIRALAVDPVPAGHAAAALNGSAGDEALASDGPGYLLEEMLHHLSTLL